MFDSIEKVYEYLFNKKGKRSNNDDLALLFNKYDNFHLKIKNIHIAGTNGKGSTVYYLASILKDAGYKVGTFTSPHMVVHNDRIQINFEMISNKKLLEYVNKYYEEFERYQLNMFQIDTFLACLYFYENEVDFGIIEVGIGGLLDSTNLIYPILSIITSVGLDHQDLLGNTLEEIAIQKLGIVKPYIPVVCNLKDNKLKNIAQKIANQNKSELIFVTKANNIKYDIEILTFNYQGIDIKLLQAGLYQVDNVSTVIEAIKVLNNKGYINIKENKISNSIEKVSYIGRFEIIQKNPYIILDGAHNIDGINQLIKTISKVKDKNIKVLYSACLDKNPNLIIEKLLEISSNVTITEFNYYRSYKKSDINPSLLDKVFYIEDYLLALYSSASNLKKDELLIITGSLYFISEIKKQIDKILKYIKLSKSVSYLLRHSKPEENLAMDKYGYASIDDIRIRVGNPTLEEIKEMVYLDNQRFKMTDDKIRACYGHSAHIHVEYEKMTPPDVLYHGTTIKSYELIKKDGIKAMSRGYVHLSTDKKRANEVAYRRSDQTLILEIDAKKADEEGINFYLGNKKTWLSDNIPSKYIKNINK